MLTLLMLLVDFGLEDNNDVYVTVTAVFITLKSVIVVDLLGLDKLTTAFGILSLLEGVGSLAGTPLIGMLCCTWRLQLFYVQPFVNFIQYFTL